jgi:glucose-1-phosphate thymidylyltransferase
MKGIILAGGLGTRLRPLTEVTNKHLLPVYDQPMIHYPIQCLLNAGINEVLVVTGGEHAGDFLKLLKNGYHLGLRRLRYAYQEGNGGIADALRLAEDFADGHPVAVVLGDNIIEGNILKGVEDFQDRQRARGAKLFLKEVPDPHRFGVARFKDDGSIAEVIEKPKNPPSSFAVTGIYLYDAKVFNICKTLEPSDRGELEITDVNNAYLMNGELTFERLEGWWTDAGTFESLLRANNAVSQGGANHLKLPSVSPTASSSPTPKPSSSLAPEGPQSSAPADAAPQAAPAEPASTTKTIEF